MNSSGAAAPAGRTGVPGVWLVLGAIVSVQVGAALAKSLFGVVPATSLVWLRLVFTAVVLLAVFRPRLRGRGRHDWLVVLAFGLTLTLMNFSIYHAFARIPLGIATTIEFLGPLAVAVLGSRRRRDLLWVGLAGAGVALLGLSRARLDPVGVAFALLAAACWAGYILLSVQTGRRWSGVSGLAVAGFVGAVVLVVPAALETGVRLVTPKVLLLGLGVALLSSVIPYSLELTALRTMAPRVFGVLMSLEPAAAALAAVVVLAEYLAPLQWLALACVGLASVGATRSAGPAPEVSPA